MSFQSDLLAFFGQQLVAHGAVLFAILAAAFTFMTQMHPKDRSGVFVYVIIGAGSLATGLYTFCRMLLYGALVDSVMRNQACDCQDLWSYYLHVTHDAKVTLMERSGAYPFIAQFFSSLNYWPTVGTCFLAGCALALAVYSIKVKDDCPPASKWWYCQKPIILSLCALFAVLALAFPNYAVGLVGGI